MGELERVSLVLDAKAELGEGPSWDAGLKALYWVDIMGRKFCRFHPETGANEEFAVGEYVGAVVPARDGSVMLATQSGFQRYDLGTNRLIPIADPEAHLPGNRFNDGKCDAQGRFWAGTMEIAETAVTGALYRLDTDLNCRKMVSDVGCSNGIAWSPDQTRMYYIDTTAQTVRAFDYEPGTGDIANPRVIIDFSSQPGFPDGMTIDEEGMLWIAHWDGWQVSRWNPATGEKLASIPVPVAKVTSCVFGGTDLDTLYITTARKGETSETLASQPHAGGIFSVQPGVRGSKTHSFGV